MNDSVTDPGQSTFPDGFSVHTGRIDVLLDRATRVSAPTDLVIAPVQLHQRNLKRRLADASMPLDAFEFVDQREVSSRLLTETDDVVNSLGRIDRLAILEEILSEATEATEYFGMLLGADPMQNVNAVDQVRTEIEAMTNYHPTRVAAFRRAVAAAPTPASDDAADVLAGTLALERALRRRTSKAPSDGEVIRRATRALRETSGVVWRQVFPAIDRVSVVGLSTVPGPLLDLVHAMATTTDVDVDWFLRRATGPYLKRRLGDLFAIAHPGRVVT